MLRVAIRGSLIAVAVLALSSGQAAANTICDLTVAGNGPCSVTGGTGSTGLFYQADPHPTGTGYIDSFLRIQQNGWEQGYNTSDRSYSNPSKVQPGYQDKIDPNFTRDLKLANVGTETINGKSYYAFFLDVNEPASTGNNANLITLDQLEIFASTTNVGQPVYSAQQANNGTGQLTIGGTTATKVYDLDTGTGSGGSGDSWVNLNYLVSSSGSGSGDMVFFLPTSAVPVGTNYIYLFSEFGSGLQGDGNAGLKYGSQAGFEEWWTNSPTFVQPFNAVPEPGSLALLGIGLIALGRQWRKRPHKSEL